MCLLSVIFIENAGLITPCSTAVNSSLAFPTSFTSQFIFISHIQEDINNIYILSHISAFQKREGILQSRQIQEEITGNTE